MIVLHMLFARLTFTRQAMADEYEAAQIVTPNAIKRRLRCTKHSLTEQWYVVLKIGQPCRLKVCQFQLTHQSSRYHEEDSLIPPLFPEALLL